MAQTTPKASGNQFNKDDLLEVFLAAERKTMRDLHCCTLALLKSIRSNNDKLVTVQPFPVGKDQSTNSTITCDCFSTSIFNKCKNAITNNQTAICIVLYLDYDSRASLKNARAGSIKIYQSSDTLHSTSNGILIAVINADGTELEESK